MSEMDRGLVDIVLLDPVDRFTALNLKQARKLVDALPRAIITQVPRSQASALKIELEAFGAIVELRAAGAPDEPTDIVR
jgi:ribosomal protein L7/L12